MKTKERILKTSLLLFNEEGEGNVTTVDIANEMEISPGNLYYHFRGKEVIIEELYGQFDREMNEILTAPVQKPLNIEDSWFYLYIVFEHVYNYRFLYFNLTDILQRYDAIQRRFKRLLRLKSSTAKALCQDLIKFNVLKNLSEAEMEALVNQIVMMILYWFSFNNINDRLNKKPEILMHEGVFQVMSLLAPHLEASKQAFFYECRDLYQNLIREAEKSLLEQI